MFWIILGGLAVIFAIIIIMYKRNIKERDRELSLKGTPMSSFIFSGKYLLGHPSLDKPIDRTVILISDGIIEIHSQNLEIDVPSKQADIPFDKVLNIVIEDASTIEKRVTVTRMFLIGLFAFAAKKKVKNELSYVTINWNDGRFDHETIFEFEGKEALEKANECRNALIRKAT